MKPWTTATLKGVFILGGDMTKHEKELQFEGIVRAAAYDDGDKGKQFLGAIIECSDGRQWVIDYEEQSPFHAFAARQVAVSGEPYEPTGQHLIGAPGGRKLGHFCVSNMRLVEVTSDANLVEVGAAQDLSGRFERSTNDSGESMLSFATEEGTTFLVANDPAGVRAGRRVEVCAYPVQPSVLTRRFPGQYLWIICPYSAADLWEWRERSRSR
jgi:hypothetical protein